MTNRTLIAGALALGLVAPGAALAQGTTLGGAAAGAVTGAIVGGPVGAVVGGVAGGALGSTVEPGVRTVYPGGRAVVMDPTLQRKWAMCANLYPSFDPSTGTFIGEDGLVHLCQ